MGRKTYLAQRISWVLVVPTEPEWVTWWQRVLGDFLDE